MILCDWMQRITWGMKINYKSYYLPACYITPKINLVLLPHVSCDLISPLIGMVSLISITVPVPSSPMDLGWIPICKSNGLLLSLLYRWISSGSYSWMKLWSAASAGGIRAWILMSYSGGSWRIQKWHLRTPKIHLMTWCITHIEQLLGITWTWKHVRKNSKIK